MDWDELNITKNEQKTPRKGNEDMFTLLESFDPRKTKRKRKKKVFHAHREGMSQSKIERNGRERESRGGVGELRSNREISYRKKVSHSMPSRTQNRHTPWHTRN